MLFRGDSASDDTHGPYKGKETFIAIGCQTGKVFVFNVLGLMVYEITMKSPIVALEWVGDMSARSVLPNRRRGLSTCVEEEENRPVLNFIQNRDKTSSSEESEEESGTVKRKELPLERSVDRSHIRFDGGRDLFSPDPKIPCLGRRRSEKLRGPSQHFEMNPEPVRRRSFLRPRIVTETFKDPSASSRPRCSVETVPDNHTTIAVQQSLKRIDSRQVFDVFFSDALRSSPSRSQSPSSEYSQPSDPEIWTTPPVIQTAAVQSDYISYMDTSIPRSQTQPSRPAIKTRHSPSSLNFSRPLPHVSEKEHTALLPRKVSFADRSFPREQTDVDQKCDRRKSSLAERSPFPPPPGQQVKREFSFERGLHEEEMKCERDYSEKRHRRTKTGTEKLGKRKRESIQQGMRRSRMSTTSEHELRLEHQRLKEEMMLLKEEFRALRQTLVDARS